MNSFKFNDIKLILFALLKLVFFQYVFSIILVFLWLFFSIFLVFFYIQFTTVLPVNETLFRFRSADLPFRLAKEQSVIAHINTDADTQTSVSI